ncbi:MAG: hypothetical protein GEU99_21005 [Luteitalea sp.]|nr:hypothetical protein [Luteitalea sp.]
MAENDDLSPPLEIPWKLASTTQPLTAGEPNDTSMSLFYYEPDDESLTSQFPDEKLVYLKFTVSLSPASFPEAASRVAASFLGEGVPCFHVLFDLTVRPASQEAGGIRPYFHAAAPLHRRVIQTGVLGSDAFEGESNGQFFGKSGSQLYETLSSQSSTSSAGGGATLNLGLVSLGGSARTTATDVTSQRAVNQVLDTTTREASQERRELVSHSTQVENVITLLNAKHLGTPYLSFSLAPRPLQLLSIDPSDPNLWFNQLLQRRSSGIEGIQEFTAVVLVPRDQGFCVNARLRRVCLFDTVPGPFRLDEPFNGDLLQLARIVQYLYRIYPPGTPLEELDIDIISPLTPADAFRRPVVELWALRLAARVIEAMVVSPSSTPGLEQRGSVNYKHFLELWLETLRDEYEQEVARSPLERGVLLGENRLLDTCFDPQEEAGFEVSGSSTSVTPLTPIDINVGDLDIGGIMTGSATATRSVRSRAFEMITRWTTLEQRLATLMANRKIFPEKPAGLDDPRIVRVLIDRWEKLAPDDPRNLTLDEAAAALNLGAEYKRLLESAGATDLRGIARALKAAPEIERQNIEVERLRKVFEKRKVVGTPPDRVTFAISRDQSAAIRQAIGSGLQKGR